MRLRFNTYTAYSIAAGIVWAVILTVTTLVATPATQHTFLNVFGGWAIGWLSATIGRAVYPPPRPRRTPADTST